MRKHAFGILLSCHLLAIASARAEEPRLIGFPNPPLIDEIDGKAVGPAAELAAELAKAAGLVPVVEIHPLARVIASAEREAIIIPLLTRTAGREHKFRWIAPIYVDELTFHTVPPNPKIKDTAAARKVKSIGVRAGSSSDAYLHANDFDALMVEDSKAEHSAHKLALGRIDAWFTSKTMGRAVWTNEKLSHIPLQHGDTVSRSVYWIAASKHVAPEIIDKIAELFRRMNADGTYDRLFSVIDNE